MNYPFKVYEKAFLNAKYVFCEIANWVRVGLLCACVCVSVGMGVCVRVCVCVCVCVCLLVWVCACVCACACVCVCFLTCSGLGFSVARLTHTTTMSVRTVRMMEKYR